MTSTINILSIDPGTNMGVTITTVSVPDLKIVSLVTKRFNLDLMTEEDPMFENLLLRLQTIRHIIKNIMEYYNPHILAMEAAFVNSKFPKSVMYLSQYIAAISMTAVEMNPFIKIFNYPPKFVKYAIGAKGTADKFDVATAVNRIEEISIHVNIDILSEHETDSIAIGYTCIDELRNNPYLLLLL